jgi:GNAT superfamily N-acetyltransferase
MNNPLHHFVHSQGDDPHLPPVVGHEPNQASIAINDHQRLEDCSFPLTVRSRPGWTAGFTEDLDRTYAHTSLSPALDLHVIDLRGLFLRNGHHALQLFDECYDLYRRSFTDPNELAPQTALIQALLRPTDPCHMLAVTQNYRVVGVRHSSIFTTQCPELGTCAFDEYLYVDPVMRKSGIGRALIERTDIMLASWGVRFIFAEINDPQVMTQELIRKDIESGISPEHRLMFWKKCGYEGLDTPYLQPPLSETLEAVFHLRVAVKQLTGTSATSVPTASLISLLRSYHSTFVPDVTRCVQATQLYEEIERARSPRIPFIALDTPRSTHGPWAHPQEAQDEQSFAM